MSGLEKDISRAFDMTEGRESLKKLQFAPLFVLMEKYNYFDCKLLTFSRNDSQFLFRQEIKGN